MRARARVLATALGLACGGVAMGGAPCPDATAREDVLPGNLSVRWCGSPERFEPVGPVEYVRDGKVVVRGELGEDGVRTGEWTLYDPETGGAIGGGRYEKSAPVGAWRFPDGIERRWLASESRFEPDGPFALIFDRSLQSPPGDPPDDWRFELIDADLDRERIAYRVVWTAYPSEGAEPPAPCNYPGQEPLAGVRLGELEPGALSPVATWDVYRPAGSEACSSEAEAKEALAAAKVGFKASGLDPKRNLAIERGSGSQVPWSAVVAGHTLHLEPTDPPSLPWELRIPALVGRAGVNDSMNGRTRYYHLLVDGRAAVRFAVADSGGQYSASLSVVGVVVDGDRASLVVEVSAGPTGSCCWTTHDVATPVFSLSAPAEPW